MKKNAKDGINRVRISRMLANQSEILAGLEWHSDEQGWRKGDFQKHLQRRHCGGFVAFDGMRAVGLVAYEMFLAQGHVLFWNLIVYTAYRNKGLARRLLKEIERSLGCEYNEVRINVREGNLDGQLFLKRMGFQAWGIARDYFHDYKPDSVSIEDAFCFRTSLPTSDPSLVGKLVIMNRLGKPIKEPADRRSGQDQSAYMLDRRKSMACRGGRADPLAPARSC